MHRDPHAQALTSNYPSGETRTRGQGGTLFMQMLCKISTAYSDVRCPVCGQGFLVYWTRLHAFHREEQRERLMAGLRLHHTDRLSTDAHPAAFHLADGFAAAPYGEAPTPSMPALLGVYS